MRNTLDRKDDPDTVWHIGSRVNWRTWHLVGEGAFRAFAECLGRAIERFGMDLLAFVLMSNHYHAVLRSPPAALFVQLTSRKTRCRHLRPYPPSHSKSTVVGQCVRQFKLDVANRIQRSLGLDGHFWDGKHFRKRVPNAETLVVMMAYDHRNPVREAMVARAEDYPRSSAAWWFRRDPAPLPLCLRPDLPFGLTVESLRAELLRFQQDKRLDDVMEIFAKTRLDLCSDDGRLELKRLMAAAGLEPSSLGAGVLPSRAVEGADRRAAPGDVTDCTTGGCVSSMAQGMRTRRCSDRCQPARARRRAARGCALGPWARRGTRSRSRRCPSRAARGPCRAPSARRRA